MFSGSISLSCFLSVIFLSTAGKATAEAERSVTQSPQDSEGLERPVEPATITSRREETRRIIESVKVSISATVTFPAPDAGDAESPEDADTIHVLLKNTGTEPIKIRKVGASDATASVTSVKGFRASTSSTEHVVSDGMRRKLREIDGHLSNPSSHVVLEPNETYSITLSIAELRKRSLTADAGERLLFKLRFERLLLGSADMPETERFVAYTKWVSTPMFWLRDGKWKLVRDQS